MQSALRFRDWLLLLQSEVGGMQRFVTKQQAAQCLSLSGSTLKKYRLSGEWIEGGHWVRLNSRCVRYNLELLLDWAHNRHDPKTHGRAIDAYRRRGAR